LFRGEFCRDPARCLLSHFEKLNLAWRFNREGTSHSFGFAAKLLGGFAGAWHRFAHSPCYLSDFSRPGHRIHQRHGHRQDGRCNCRRRRIGQEHRRQHHAFYGYHSDGAYVVPGLPGDTYDLVVTAKGFQKFTVQHVVLSVAEKARVDVSLTVGAVSEEVVVTGESIAQVETSSSEIGTTISGKQVQQLELNGRNFTQLVTLTPGVVNQTGSDEGQVGVYGNVAYSVNGGRTEYNNWELDGGDNMDNGSNSTLNVYPNIEAIAEFKVLTSNYGAQYGRNGSGTIEVETKSGTQSFHGSAFEYLRNDMFNARPWESGNDPAHPNPPYKKHDFGYTVGGPVYIPGHYNSDKKKTFFFWSQEWRREKNPSTVSPQNVPSDAERSGDFTALCASDPADCPSGPQVTNFHITPTATGAAFLALIPEPNTTAGGFPAVSSIVSTPTTWREELIRIDHNLTDNYRLTFRYIHDSWSTVVPNPFGATVPRTFKTFRPISSDQVRASWPA